MRILLTGRDGQVGWELHRALSVLGEVIAPSRVQLDLGSAAVIVRQVREIRPNLIVNAAAYTAVDKAEQETDVAHRVNAEAPGVLAEEALRLGAPLIHYSTDYVFDGRNQAAYTEDDAASPLNVYGRTKLLGERHILDAGAAALIIRTSWVYAARGRNFFLTIRRLAAERPEIKVVDDQVGSPTWARLIAEATAQILARGCGPGGPDPDWFAAFAGLYHMTSAGSCSWFEFAGAIRALHDLPATLISVPSSEYSAAATRPANSRLDNAKLRARFGIQLPDWRLGLALCADDGQTWSGTMSDGERRS